MEYSECNTLHVSATRTRMPYNWSRPFYKAKPAETMVNSTPAEAGCPAHGTGSAEHHERERTGLRNAGNDVVIEHAIGRVASLDDFHFIKRSSIRHSEKEDVVVSPTGTNLHWHVDNGARGGVSQAKRGWIIIGLVATLNYESAKGCD